MTTLLLLAGLAADPVTTFPIITADDLNGRRVTIPEDLPGAKRLVFIGYDRDQQPAIDEWIRYAVSLRVPERDLGISEVALLNDPGMIGRGIIDSAMKLAIRDRKTRSRVVPVYGDQDELRVLTGCASVRTIDVVLLDSEGRIVWREEGRLTPEKKADLRSRVAAADG